MDQRLVEYINSSRTQGMTDEQIKSSLLASGWTIEAITEALAFSVSNIPPTSKVEVVSPKLENKPSRSKLIPIIAALVVIIIIGGGVVWYFNNKKGSVGVSQTNPTQSTSSESVASQPKSGIELSTPSTASTVDKTWKTYLNKTLGFEIKYPSGWYADEQFTNPDNQLGYDLSLILSRKQNISPEELKGIRTATSLDDVLKKTETVGSLISISGSAFPANIDAQLIKEMVDSFSSVGSVKTSTTSFNGINMTKIETQLRNGLFMTTVLASNGKYIYFFTLAPSTKDNSSEKNQTDFNAMISTVKFMKPQVEVGMDAWSQISRDGRRNSDLRQIEGIIMLYYTKYGIIPGTVVGKCDMLKSWMELGDILLKSDVGFTSDAKPPIPNDPIEGKTYIYKPNATCTDFVLAATFENASSSMLKIDTDGTVNGINCNDPVYCVKF